MFFKNINLLSKVSQLYDEFDEIVLEFCEYNIYSMCSENGKLWGCVEVFAKLRRSKG